MELRHVYRLQTQALLSWAHSEVRLQQNSQMWWFDWIGGFGVLRHPIQKKSSKIVPGPCYWLLTFWISEIFFYPNVSDSCCHHGNVCVKTLVILLCRNHRWHEEKDLLSLWLKRLRSCSETTKTMDCKATVKVILTKASEAFYPPAQWPHWNPLFSYYTLYILAKMLSIPLIFNKDQFFEPLDKVPMNF